MGARLMIIKLIGGPLDGAFHPVDDDVLETRYELLQSGDHPLQVGWVGRLLAGQPA